MKKELIYAAKEFIDSHLSTHYSILQIAREIGINEQDLKKGFKELFGKGMFEYLLSERLTIARVKIEDTTKPVKEIAYAAGYKSAGNFSTAFKKKFGKNPLAWRRDYKKNNRTA